MKGFLLGLANGTFCFAYCSAILVPYLLSEGKNVQRNFITISYFLSGRLIGYLAFAIVAWITNLIVIQNLTNRTTILGVVYIALAVLLMFYGFGTKEPHCVAKSTKALKKRYGIRHKYLLPVILGVLTGLNLCPPFLLAFTTAVEKDSLRQCLLFFLTFFIGTSVYLIPLPTIGLLRRYDILRPVGRLAAGVMGVYYIYFGFITFQGSIH